MPASEVMEKFKRRTLHSGRGKHGKKGKIVRSKKQAKVIQLSYLRKEGYNIPPSPKKVGKKKHRRKRA